jgi:hypothetical protein
VAVGEHLIARAKEVGAEGRRRTVRCTVFRGEEAVLEGELTCYVPERHVLAAAATRGEEGGAR